MNLAQLDIPFLTKLAESYPFLDPLVGTVVVLLLCYLSGHFW